MTEISHGATLQHAGVQASLTVLEELYDDMAAFLRPLDDAILNWTPLPAETNSIAALVRHIIGANRAWLARAIDEPFERDRDAEFRARDSAPSLVAALEASRIEARRRLEHLDTIDPSTIRMVVRLQTPEPVAVTAAWCVVHALRHAGEHWGQIQLSRQLYEFSSPS
jgi:hypothetical protein